MSLKWEVGDPYNLSPRRVVASAVDENQCFIIVKFDSHLYCGFAFDTVHDERVYTHTTAPSNNVGELKVALEVLYEMTKS